MKYTFTTNNKEYNLTLENLDCFFNDEENPIEGLDEEKVLDLLSKSSEVTFANAYFEIPCENCKGEEKKKAYEFLEYYFYAYSKDGKYVSSSIDNNYDGKSFTRLNNEGVVDNSYIVRIIVCRDCGIYTIEVEEFEL